MISYATVGVNDLAVSAAFYDAVLAVLGVARCFASDHSIAYADAAGAPKLWLNLPYDGKAACVGNGSMLGFSAATRAQVDAFHAAGVAAGGVCDGKPGLRHYGPNVYLAYLRDPVGNKVSAVCYAPD
jgi:catechol 2,3-dioxygenase-like lactoylglutathione lyase family enzyme